MRHRKKSEKFSRPRAQRKALVKALLRAVIINERIITTEPRAKYLRSGVDKLITWAKKGSLANKRLAYSLLGNHNLVKQLFDNIGPRFKDIEGGYTRVLSVGYRKGDGAPLSLIELTKLVKKKKGVDVKAQKEKAVESKEEKAASKRKEESKKGILTGVKSIFKKGKKPS